MITRELQICNKLGLHARAAAKVVSTASRFESHIELSYRGRAVNAKSIMGVMMLAASKGSMIELTAQGADAEEASDAIESLVNDRFGEDQ